MVHLMYWNCSGTLGVGSVGVEVWQRMMCILSAVGSLGWSTVGMTYQSHITTRCVSPYSTVGYVLLPLLWNLFVPLYYTPICCLHIICVSLFLLFGTTWTWLVLLKLFFLFCKDLFLTDHMISHNLHALCDLCLFLFLMFPFLSCDHLATRSQHRIMIFWTGNSLCAQLYYLYIDPLSSPLAHTSICQSSTLNSPPTRS